MNAKTLDVYYKGIQVGTLASMKDGRVAFQYSDNWLKTGFSISPFSLPLKSDVFIPKQSATDIFKGFFGVFADSLPDTWGELLLDRHLSSMGIRSISPIERLAYVGTSGMGALEYFPSKHAEYAIEGLDYDEIASECEKVLSSKPVDKLDLLFGLGGSSGGTRPKILVEENGHHWIIKFPASRDPSISGKREYDYSMCARKCGIIMTDTELLPSNVCEGYFKTARFDRIKNHKIMTVTFAGLLEADYRAPSCDYSVYMRLINILSRENMEQVDQMYRTMCFNVLAHNRDDHAKNFSFLFDENQGWHLAPAYDLTYSDTYFGEQTTSVNGKGKDITETDLVSVGFDAGMKKTVCRELYDMISSNSEDLSEYLRNRKRRRAGKISVQKRVNEIKE